MTAPAQKAHRYSSDLDGLKAVVADVKYLKDITIRLTGVIREENLISTGIRSRLELFKGFIDKIITGAHDADVQRTVGFGGALERDFNLELDSLFSGSVAAFTGTAETIRRESPEVFAANRQQIEEALANLTAADQKSRDYDEMLSPYMDAHKLLVPMLSSIRRDKQEQEVRAREASRHSRSTKTMIELRELVGAL